MKHRWATSLTATVLALAGAAVGMAQNVTGTITCDSRGVAGVAVSDGHQVVLTDENGRYALSSDKQCGYVFYTLPGGYEPLLTDGFNPQFWSGLDTSDTTVQENHDFVLRRVDNDRHIVLIGTDVHLARLNNDREQFQQGIITFLNDEVKLADGIPVYSILLGDLTWDLYWYQNHYDLSDFMDDMRQFQYPVTLWPVMGNHDNDPSTLPWINTDWESTRLWRNELCPPYYSFNLGQVHYVVLDNIIYVNQPRPGEEYAEGVVGSRNYRATISDEQLSWLSEDLALIDSGTPLVVCMHIPAWGVTSSFGHHNTLYNTDELCALLTRFDNVHIMSGHTHVNNSTRPEEYSGITEHNLGASSGTLWQCGNLTGHHVCQDGTPAGFLRWTANGDDVQWLFRPIHGEESQLRLYDMNTVSEFYRSDATMRAILDAYPSRMDYASLDSNTVMVNVFAYDTHWRVELCEGDSLLECSRVYAEDPFHTLAYDVAQYRLTGNYSTAYVSKPTAHLFQARAATATLPIVARAIDPFGNIYLSRIERPHGYSLEMERHEGHLDLGDLNMDGRVNIDDVTFIIDCLLGYAPSSSSPLLLDCDGDDKVDIADVTTIINLILNK